MSTDSPEAIPLEFLEHQAGLNLTAHSVRERKEEDICRREQPICLFPNQGLRGLA